MALAGAGTAWAADPEIDKLLQSPVGKDWVTNGGNLTNQRYSTLKQIDTNNVKQLKGAWMTRLKGSGFGGKYSGEATPLVKDGIMYMVTGNDDVFALNAKTGEIQWERWSGLDQKISTVCWVGASERARRSDLERARGGRGYNCTGRTTSHTERRQSRRLLTIKAPDKSLSFLIVRKLHGKNDCLVVLIVIELRWLVSVAIEPFAHGG